MKYAILALAVALMAPCDRPTNIAADTAKPAAVVHMKNFKFDPATVTIKTGQSVQWVNDDQVQHSATADDKSFDSGELANGKSYTQVFAKTGTFSYYCDDHTYMKAKVVVK
jgi:plastocyanin